MYLKAFDYIDELDAFIISGEVYEVLFELGYHEEMPHDWPINLFIPPQMRTFFESRSAQMEFENDIHCEYFNIQDFIKKYKTVELFSKYTGLFDPSYLGNYMTNRCIFLFTQNKPPQDEEFTPPYIKRLFYEDLFETLKISPELIVEQSRVIHDQWVESEKNFPDSTEYEPYPIKDFEERVKKIYERFDIKPPIVETVNSKNTLSQYLESKRDDYYGSEEFKRKREEALASLKASSEARRKEEQAIKEAERQEKGLKKKKRRRNKRLKGKKAR